MRTRSGPLDRVAESAWRDVVAAEPALRTSFTWRDGGVRRDIRDGGDHRDHVTCQLGPRYRLRMLAEEWTRISLSFALDAPPLFALALSRAGSRSI